MFSSSENDASQNFNLTVEGLLEPDGAREKAEGAATTTFAGSRFSMEELKSMQESYMAEARRLQEEVNNLQEELEEENMAALSIPSATLDLLRNILKMKSEEEQDMHGMHEMQSSLSGVQLTDATTQIISNNPQLTVRLQRLEGTCSGLGFVASFEVEETVVRQTSEEQKKASETEDQDRDAEVRKAFIRKLDLEVDPCCLGEMVTFLSEAEKACDLQPFLRGYADYAKWYQHRVTIFSRFVKDYPETVSLPGGQDGTTLQIMCPQQRGIIYTVTWRIDVARTGECTPNVSLDVKSAKEVSKLDTKNTLSRAPEEFKKMVDTLGVEKALNSFLKAVALN